MHSAGISLLIYEGWPSIANSIAKISKDFSIVGIFLNSGKNCQYIAFWCYISIFHCSFAKKKRPR